MSDRQPPYNLEAEGNVIGALFLEPAMMHEVRGVLEPQDFFRGAYGLVYGAIASLYDSGMPFDPTCVLEALGASGGHRAAGGEETIAACLASLPHAGNARYHAEIVRQKSIARKLIVACEETIRECYDQQSTGEEIADAAEARVLAAGESGSRDESVGLGEAAVGALEAVERREQGEVLGVESGFRDLDDALGNLQPRRLYILAARPSIGKSAIALNIADRVSYEGMTPVLFVSLEMDRHELATRSLTARARVDGFDLLHPRRLDDAKRGRLMEAAAKAKERSRLVIADPPHLTVGQLCARARRHAARDGLGLLVIDYLQLVDGQPRKGELREQEVARVSRRLKGLARELKIPVLALAQLNRAVEGREDRKPRLSDLRESGQLEQDADVVMLLHRPDYYDPEDQPGTAFIIVAKNRGGATGTVQLRFVRGESRFETFEPDLSI